MIFPEHLLEPHPQKDWKHRRISKKYVRFVMKVQFNPLIFRNCQFPKLVLCLHMCQLQQQPQKFLYQTLRTFWIKRLVAYGKNWQSTKKPTRYCKIVMQTLRGRWKRIGFRWMRKWWICWMKVDHILRWNFILFIFRTRAFQSGDITTQTYLFSSSHWENGIRTEV